MKLNGVLVLCAAVLTALAQTPVCDEGANGYENCDENAVTNVIKSEEKQLEIPVDENEDAKFKKVAEELGITIPTEKPSSKRTFGFGFSAPAKFPKCPVDVPMCYRTKCGGHVGEYSASQCLSNPACCFDKDLHLYRRVAGPGYMRGAPVCYHGATSVQYQKIALMFYPWNAHFTERIVKYFTTAFDTNLLHMGGNPLCYYSPYYAQIRPTCGWPGIKEKECNLRGCCWTKKKCEYPDSPAIAHYRKQNVYPELIAQSASEQTCVAHPFTDPDLFRRLPCLKVNTKDSMSVRTCQMHCCMDMAALPKPPQPKYNPFQSNSKFPFSPFNPYMPPTPPPKKKRTSGRRSFPGCEGGEEEDKGIRSLGLFENKSPIMQFLLNQVLSKATGGKYGSFGGDYEHHNTGDKYEPPYTGSPSYGNNYPPNPMTNNYPYAPNSGGNYVTYGNGHQQQPPGYGYPQSNSHYYPQQQQGYNNVPPYQGYGGSSQGYGASSYGNSAFNSGYGSGGYNPYSSNPGYPSHMGGGIYPPMNPFQGVPKPPKCPFIFKKIKGLPSLANAVKGCCDIHICYHKKTYVPQPSYIFGQWTHWSSCQHTCGANLGTKTRDRVCIDANTRQPANPRACQGSLTDTQPCGAGMPCPTLPPKFTQPPPQKFTHPPVYAPTFPQYPGYQQRQITAPIYEWGDWTMWSDCDATCGTAPGSQTRGRVCMNMGTKQPALPDNCEGEAKESKPCFSGKMCPTEPPKYAPGPGEADPNLPPPGPAIPYQSNPFQGAPRTGDIVQAAYKPADEWLQWSPCSQKADTGICAMVRARLCVNAKDEAVEPTLCGIENVIEKKKCTCPNQKTEKQVDKKEEMKVESEAKGSPWTDKKTVKDESIYEWTEFNKCAGTCGKRGYKSRTRHCREGEISDDCTANDSGKKICGGQLCQLNCPEGVTRIEKDEGDFCWLDPELYYK